MALAGGQRLLELCPLIGSNEEHRNREPCVSVIPYFAEGNLMSIGSARIRWRHA